MLSIAERIEQARTFVIDIFELDARTIEVTVVEWTMGDRNTVQVKIVVQNAVQMQVAVDPEGRADLVLAP
jgi:hypothetical protein